MENKESFHQIMGGRIRRDNRFIFEEKAQKTQQYLMVLKERGVDMVDLAQTIGVTISTLSLAAGGRAGTKPQPQFGNLSSTDYILKKLSDMLEEQDEGSNI